MEKANAMRSDVGPQSSCRESADPRVLLLTKLPFGAWQEIAI